MFASACSGSSCWGFVLRAFLQCASRCPMAVASREGGNQFSVASVRPANGKNPFCSACFKVDMAGENNAAWANATRSAGVLVWRLIAGAALRWRLVAACWVQLVSCRTCGGSVHNPLLCHGHVMLLPSGVVMMHWCLSKVTWHPWSHNGATMCKELWRSGNMCAVFASCGTPLIGISAMCVECVY